ncbi:META domain-containing protein [Winogradskyella sp.]|uniref:META domain-containing protein n=1 Tax=Winogradskyella sp. TaxID=1883156 RepID=UPI0035121CB9
MKTTQLLLITFLSLAISSCASSKQDKLYDITWELEYITGPRIAFDGLYPDKKPKISFNKDTKKVSGNNSCNGYTADFTIEEDAISFGEPGPSTLMYCGEGEQVFLNIMEKINTYSFSEDGKLNLLMDDVVMMRFHKVTD